MDELRYRKAEDRLWSSLGLEPRERVVRLPRLGTEVRVQETGEGPPVLFVHGSTNSGTSWATLMRQLPGFRCIALDRPGCGLSEPLPTAPGVEGLPGHADDLLVDVLDGLGLDRAPVVATSFGGYLALRGAIAHPGRFQRLLLLGWPVGAPTGRLPLLMRLASLPGAGRLMAAMPVTEGAVRSMFKQIGLGAALAAGRISPELISCYAALLRHTDTGRNELAIGGGAGLPDLVEALVLTDTELGAVGCPTYLLWGGNDPFGDAAVARAFAARIADAHLEILPAAGHAVWLDDVEHTGAVARDFLGQPGPTTDGARGEGRA